MWYNSEILILKSFRKLHTGKTYIKEQYYSIRHSKEEQGLPFRSEFTPFVQSICTCNCIFFHLQDSGLNAQEKQRGILCESQVCYFEVTSLG